jgi:hypothetical protein
VNLSESAAPPTSSGTRSRVAQIRRRGHHLLRALHQQPERPMASGLMFAKRLIN